MVDLEEGGLVSGAAGLLGVGWRVEEGALFEMEVIFDFQSSMVSRLLLAMR